jgi:polar amino acid transport system ATP-binding protein
VADEVVFMADGAVVETGPPDRVLTAPSHERTRQFLARVL